MHKLPSPKKPVLQLHSKLPIVFKHSAFLWQLCPPVRHSSISEENISNGNAVTDRVHTTTYESTSYKAIPTIAVYQYSSIGANSAKSIIITVAIFQSTTTNSFNCVTFNEKE